MAWSDPGLEKQIDFGARSGEIDFDEALKELKNFRRNVKPVAEYFDYKHMLYQVILSARRVKFLRYFSIKIPITRSSLFLVRGLKESSTPSTEIPELYIY